MPAPDNNCSIIPGSMMKLFIAEDPAAPTLDWLLVGDLDNYTLTTDSTDTSLNTGGWIRSLPMERGISLTATGRLAVADPGQKEVEKIAFAIGCDALAYWRLLIPGPKEGDPPYLDWGFWAWANMQDRSAASTDPISWGVELRFWSEPIDLVDGQPPAGQSAEAQAPGGTPVTPQTQPASTPAVTATGTPPRTPRTAAAA